MIIYIHIEPRLHCPANLASFLSIGKMIRINRLEAGGRHYVASRGFGAIWICAPMPHCDPEQVT